MAAPIPPNLDDDLSIPPTATLRPPPSPLHAATLECSGSSIRVAPETSIRSAAAQHPRCLVAGRQASTADVRIDHGSISRRHAAVYYDVGGSGGSGGGGGVRRLVLQDLGGKKGTRINGNRIAKKGIVELRDGDEITFGNVGDRVFKVSWAGTKEVLGEGYDVVAEAEDAAAEESNTKRGNATTDGDNNNEEDNETSKSAADEALAGLTGRDRREAEIAAMMASLDENPAYKRYVAPAEDEQDVRAAANGGGPSAARPSAAQSSTDTKRAPAATTTTTKPGHGLPVTQTVSLTSSAASDPDPSNPKPGGGKVISTLTTDPAGSRLVTGCTDSSLRLYDFGGMDANHNAFREVEVEEGHPIVDVCYSNTGDRMIVGTTSAQPKVLDRDGREIVHFAKGDVYVTDMSRTIGHTATVTSVAWHPLERDVVLTSSLDGSARTWDLAKGKTVFKKLTCDRVYRAKNGRGQRTPVTSCAFHPGGRELALGTADGSVQIWNATRVGTRPDRVVFDAHGTGQPINCVVYNTDGSKLATRSMDDDTVKVWEARKLSKSAKPILTCSGLPSLYEGSNCAFGPDGTVLVAGTSIEPRRKGQEQSRDGPANGVLKFYRVPSAKDGARSSAAGTQSFLEIDAAMGASVVGVAWHPRLNQICVGSSDGNARIFYDSNLSTKGALLSTAKGARRKDELSLLLESRAPQGSAAITGEIMTPHALPMFRTEKEKEKAAKRKRSDSDDLAKSKKPQPPEGGIKTGGQTSASVNFTQFIVKSTIKNKNIAGKDPREELFKYSEGKSYVSKAYEGDRQHVLTEKTAEEEEEEMKSKKK